METLTLFVAYLPAIVPLVPLVGLGTVSLSGLAGRSAAIQTLRGNLVLSLSLGTILLMAASRLPITAHTTLPAFLRSSEAGSAPEFLRLMLDGINLPSVLLVIVVCPALAARWLTATTAGPSLRLFLLWQASVLAVLCAGDLAVLSGGLLLSTLATWGLLANVQPRSRDGLTRRFSVQLVASMLVLGGAMGFCSVGDVMLTRDGRPWTDPGFQSLQEDLAELSDDDTDAVVRFRQRTEWCGMLIMIGALLRLGILPLQRNPARFGSEGDSYIAIVMWIEGPAMSIVLAWRALQVAPTLGEEWLPGLAPWLCAAVVWFGLAASRASTPRERESIQRQQWSALAGLAICSSNLTAYAGALLTICAVPLMQMLREHRNGDWGTAARGWTHLLAGLCLWGVLRGSGAGSNAPGLFFLAAVGYLLGHKPESFSRRRSISNDSALPHDVRPVWDRDSHSEPETNEVRTGWTQVVLRVAACGLLWPQWLWQPAARELAELPFIEAPRRSTTSIESRESPPAENGPFLESSR